MKSEMFEVDTHELQTLQLFDKQMATLGNSQHQGICELSSFSPRYRKCLFFIMNLDHCRNLHYPGTISMALSASTSKKCKTCFSHPQFQESCVSWTSQIRDGEMISVRSWILVGFSTEELKISQSYSQENKQGIRYSKCHVTTGGDRGRGVMWLCLLQYSVKTSVHQALFIVLENWQ